MSQIHVTSIIQSLGIGGAEQSLVNLINYSDPEKYKFSIIIFDDLQTIVPRIKRKDVKIVIVPKKGKLSLGLIGKLTEVLSELKTDIVHTHLFTADVWGTLAAKRLGLPTVLTEHGFNTEYGWLRNMFKRFVADKSTVYVACSEAVKSHMQQAYRVTKPIVVIENGIEVNKFFNVPSPSFVEPFSLCIIGRLSPEKGHALAFEALSELRDFRWRLSVVGAGPLEKKLKRIVRKKMLGERIDFAGLSDNVPDVLNNNDIVLVPSLSEGLSTVAREAMAAGRLVVASDVGGLGEFIEHGKTGLLFSKEDKNALINILTNIFSNPAEYRRIAEQAREKAKGFTVENMVKFYTEVYRSLL